MIYPFDQTIWLLFIASMFIFGAGFTFIAKVEGTLHRWNLKEWNTYYEASWYAYGTFIGEAVTRDTKSDKAPALRIAIAIWILYCMIMAYSYCGTLRSFLIKPVKNAPITTLKEVRQFLFYLVKIKAEKFHFFLAD